jgi:DNA-binding CsgD family transcriptional regulator
MSIFLDSPLVCPVMIGRTEYLAALVRYINGCAGGQGHTLLLKGEAGVGKSRLVAEALARATEAGVQSGQAACFEYQPAAPFAPILEILRDLLTLPQGEPNRTLLEACSGSERWVLSRLMPELVPPGMVSEQARTYEPEQEKQLIFSSLVQFFGRLAAGQPLLLIFEDLHWCDETSLEFLLQLARRIISQPVLILLTYRSDEINPALGHFLAELDRARLATEITLFPFSPVETGQMLQKILEFPQPVRNDFLNPIYDLTEGNPFYIEEVLRSLIASGDIYRRENRWERKPVNDLHIPRSIHDTIQRRSLRLSQPTREVLHLAAVIGRRFDLKLLEQASGRAEQTLIEQLKELMAAQLLKEEGNEQLAFRHALARQAIYTTLLGLERKGLHARIGETIEKLYAQKVDDHLPELAYHFYQAGNWQKAYDYALQVGRRALTLHAPLSVIDNLNRAEEVAGYLGKTPPGWLYKTRARAYEMKGAFDASRQDFTKVLEIARRKGDTQEEWQSLLELGSLWAGHTYEQAGEYFQQAHALAQKLKDAGLEGHTLNRLGNWYSNTGRLEESLAAHYRALAIFEGLGDKPGLAQTHDLLCMTHGLTGNATRAIAHAGPAITLARELGDERSLISTLSEYAVITSYNHIADPVIFEPGIAKNYRQTQVWLAEALELARQSDWLAGEAYILFNICGAGVTNGELEKSLEIGRQALQVATEIGHQQWLTAGYLALGGVYLYLLQFEAAQDCLEKGLALGAKVGSTHWVWNALADLIPVYLEQGNLAGAEKLLAENKLPDRKPRLLGERRAALAAAKLALAQGEPRTALEIVERIRASFPDPALQRPGPDLLFVKAQAQAALEQWEEALNYLLAAKAVLEQWQIVPLRWEIQTHLYSVYQRLKQPEPARQALETARVLIHRYAEALAGNDLRQHLLAHALAKLPTERPLSVRQARQLTFDGLTGREQEVARQIALGKTNREIGQVLTLSERTVEGHVGRILAKLDFNSRSQVAVWAVEKGLTAG